MAYATVSDLEARWRPLSDSEKARASVLLEDAALYIDAFAFIDPTNAKQLKRACRVSCSMVERSMQASDNGMFGVSQQTISADIYSQSITAANPNGDLYLTSAEKRLLGATSSYLYNIRPVIDPVKEERHDLWRDC